MTISVDDWKQMTKEVLGDIANEDDQKLTWFGKNPTAISGPTESINGLEDCFFESRFIDSPRIGLSDNQKTAARDFCKTVDDFFVDNPDCANSSKMINNPRWIKVREAAKNLIPILFPDSN